MRFMLVLVGLVAAIFVLPMFMTIYNDAILPLTESIESPILQMIFIVIPYAAPVVLVIAAFLLLRSRRSL